jgi:hypothetical protein
MKEKVIYTKRIAYELRLQGFKILRTGINKNYPQFTTWIFEDTKELNDALSNLK